MTNASVWNPGVLVQMSGANTLREDVVLAAGQTLVLITTFTYVQGNAALFVFINGVLLTNFVDYSETSTSSITLANPAIVLDTLTFLGIS